MRNVLEESESGNLTGNLSIASDADLVIFSLSDDSAAFEALVHRYYGMVFSLAYARLRDPNAAEELAQEVFLRSFLRLNTLREPRYFSSWVTRITRNLAEDWVRDQLRASTLLPMITLQEIGPDTADYHRLTPRAAAARQEEFDRLNAALSGLPLSMREVVIMHFMNDLDKAEIARLLGLHPSSVGRQINSALSRLRNSLSTGSSEGLMRESSKRHRRGIKRTCALLFGLLALNMNERAVLAAQLLSANASTFPNGPQTPVKPVMAMGTRTLTAIRAALHKLTFTLNSLASYRLTSYQLVNGVIVVVLLGVGSYFFFRSAAFRDPVPSGDPAVTARCSSEAEALGNKTPGRCPSSCVTIVLRMPDSLFDAL
jgi:RNA polymerase sigma-70 factor, ECF subfamily